MTIMAERGLDDARTTTRLLAGAAVECLDNPKVSASRETALDNVYRLLEYFRTNPVFGFISVENHRRESIDTLTVAVPRERHLSQVCDALQQAVVAVFGKRSSRQSAIVEVEEVLRSLLDPGTKASPAARERAKRFFTELTQRLPAT